VTKYAIDTKPSARKELENLSDSLISRLVPKIKRRAKRRAEAHLPN
jgi:hypothetical protein